MSTDSLVVVATGLSVFALLVVVAVTVQVGRLRRAYEVLVAGDEGSSFVDAVSRHTAATRAARADLQVLHEDVASVRADLSASLRHTAVVRYDAFGDVAGGLSFSVALLDARGDGLVLTSLAARSETRTYAKAVRSGAGETALSPEEQDAVHRALRGERAAV